MVSASHLELLISKQGDQAGRTFLLQEVLDHAHCFCPFQSSFGPGVETKMALFTLVYDLCWGLDTGRASLLVLLDSLVPFDIISHSALSSRIVGWIGTKKHGFSVVLILSG